MPPTPEQAPPVIVLDTNVVLDWLVFRDASTAALGAAVDDGAARWLATGAMRDGLATVVARATATDPLSWERHSSRQTRLRVKWWQ